MSMTWQYKELTNSIHPKFREFKQLLYNETLEVVDGSMVFTFSQQGEGILILLRGFTPMGCDAMLFFVS